MRKFRVKMGDFICVYRYRKIASHNIEYYDFVKNAQKNAIISLHSLTKARKKYYNSN